MQLASDMETIQILWKDPITVSLACIALSSEMLHSHFLTTILLASSQTEVQTHISEVILHC